MIDLGKAIAFAFVVVSALMFSWSVISLIDEYRGPTVALRMGADFLVRHGRRIEFFSGPIIIDRPHVVRTYRWASQEDGFLVELSVSPSGGMICLEREIEFKKWEAIDCEID